MTKVIYVTNRIPNYRKGLYERLGKKIELTIAHYGELNPSSQYKEIKLNVKKGNFFIKIQNSIDYSQYDVVLIWCNLKLLELYKLTFKRKRKYKLLVFGPGVSASYTKKYDSSRIVSFVIKRILNKVDAGVFYDNYPVIKYSGLGVNPHKLFCAPNTVDIELTNTITINKRNTFLFFGTLYKEKGTFILLEAYKILCEKHNTVPILNIVGDGPELQNLKDWVNINGFTRKIFFHGRITDQEKIRGFFSNAIACISPKQAGLSVIESMAHGVPFVTSKYPITGGEYNAIIEGANGFFYDESKEHLAKVLNDISRLENFDFYSQNCKEYYKRFRSPKLWVSQLLSSIKYSLRNERR